MRMQIPTSPDAMAASSASVITALQNALLGVDRGM